MIASPRFFRFRSGLRMTARRGARLRRIRVRRRPGRVRRAATLPALKRGQKRRHRQHRSHPRSQHQSCDVANHLIKLWRYEQSHASRAAKSTFSSIRRAPKTVKRDLKGFHPRSTLSVALGREHPGIPKGDFATSSAKTTKGVNAERFSHRTNCSANYSRTWLSRIFEFCAAWRLCERGLSTRRPPPAENGPRSSVPASPADPDASACRSPTPESRG